MSILSPLKGLGFPGGEGVGEGGGLPVRPKHLKKCIKLRISRGVGGGILRKISSMGEVWIFSGTTQ